MAAKASDDTSRRVKRKHLETARAGLPSGGGPRPFGFEDDRVTLRESEAQRIRDAAARLLGGDSLGVICRDWAADGVLTPKGNRWGTSELRRMLEAPRVAGKRSLGSEVVADAVWPAILDEKTWRRVKQHLARRSAPAGQAARSYLLSGLIYCGVCKVPMTAHPLTARGKRYRRYFCLKSRGGCNRVGISADGAEDSVIKAMLLAARELTPSAPTRLQVEASSGQERARLLAERDEAAEMAGISLSAKDFARIAANIDARLAELDRAEARSVAGRDLSTLASSSDPEAVWEAWGFARQRQVVEFALVKVFVAPAATRGGGFDASRLDPKWRE
jgi:hypothetical protein